MYCSVCNNLYDVIDYKTKDETKRKNNSSLFSCSNCHTKKLIPNGTIIYSKALGNQPTKYATDELSNVFVNSKILLHTREYTCPNIKCESHTNVEKREAVIFRKYNNAHVIYICNSCKTNF